MALHALVRNVRATVLMSRLAVAASRRLDDVNLALVMAALASFNVSGADTEDEENVPMVRDKDFIADTSWELEVRETPGLLSLLQLAGQHFSQLLATSCWSPSTLYQPFSQKFKVSNTPAFSLSP